MNAFDENNLALRARVIIFKINSLYLGLLEFDAGAERRPSNKGCHSGCAAP